MFVREIERELILGQRVFFVETSVDDKGNFVYKLPVEYMVGITCKLPYRHQLIRYIRSSSDTISPYIVVFVWDRQMTESISNS